MDFDVKQYGSILRRFAKALFNFSRRKLGVIGAKPRPDLLKFRGVQQLERVDRMLFEIVTTAQEKRGESRRRSERIPKREANTDRFHSN